MKGQLEEKLKGLGRLGIKPGLGRMTWLLERLGNPHQGMRCVHVAGTNGKGSTSLILAALLQSAGYNVGRYSSPHVVSYQERFVINGREISPGLLQYYLEIILDSIRSLSIPVEDHPTEFEVLTAAAFLYFRELNVDVAIIEAGMGGSEDATNCIEPMVSIITTIGHDHGHFLGRTLAEIAAHKAGIIKWHRPVVLGPMEEEARQVALSRARVMQARVYDSTAVRIHSVSNDGFCGQTIDIQLPDRYINEVVFSLTGDYQLDNLACALAGMMTLEEQTYVVTDEYIRKALGKLHIAGRLEVLSAEPLVVCDAAHNQQAVSALTESLERILPGRTRVIICGMLDDKDSLEMLRTLGNGTRVCIVTQPHSERNRDWKRVAAHWQKVCPQRVCYLVQDISEAVELGLSLLRREEYLLITGSFYVVGVARRIFRPEE